MRCLHEDLSCPLAQQAVEFVTYGLDHELSRCVLRVCDFGLSNTLSVMSTDPGSGQPGTLIFAAPEVLDGGSFNPTSDVYSFGMLAFHLFSQGAPTISESIYFGFSLTLWVKSIIVSDKMKSELSHSAHLSCRSSGH